MKLSKYKKYFIFMGVIIILGIIAWEIKNSNILDFDYLQTIIESSGVWAPVVFGLFYILITSFGFSTIVLTVLAGVIFGTFMGLIIIVIAATISGQIGFYIARYFRENFLGSNKDKGNINFFNKTISRIERTCEKNGFQTVAILRLTFLPYMPLSYACGLVRKLKSSDFFWATFITNIFGGFIFIYFGDRLGGIIRGETDLATILTLVLAVVLLVLFIVYVPKITKKLSK